MIELHQIGSPVNPELWASLATKFGPLPSAYQAFIEQHNGGRPLPPAIPYFDAPDATQPVGVQMVQAFLPVRHGAGVQVGWLVEGNLQTYFQYTKGFPHGLIAIANTPTWQQPAVEKYVLLSCRPDDAGRVYLYVNTPSRSTSNSGQPHPQQFDPKKLYFVAANFTAFLDRFHWPASVQPWLEAIERGNVAAIADWLAQGGNVDADDPIVGMSPFAYAIRGNHITSRTAAAEASNLAILQLMLPKSRTPQTALDAVGPNWSAIAVILEHVQALPPLKRALKLVGAEVERMAKYRSDVIPSIERERQELLANLKRQIKSVQGKKANG